MKRRRDDMENYNSYTGDGLAGFYRGDGYAQHYGYGDGPEGDNGDGDSVDIDYLMKYYFDDN